MHTPPIDRATSSRPGLHRIEWAFIASTADDDADIDFDGRAYRSPSSGASASAADYRRHGEELAFDLHPSLGITVDLYHDTVVRRANLTLPVPYLRLQRDLCTASSGRPAACAATTPTHAKTASATTTRSPGYI